MCKMKCEKKIICDEENEVSYRSTSVTWQVYYSVENDIIR